MQNLLPPPPPPLPLLLLLLQFSNMLCKKHFSSFASIFVFFFFSFFLCYFSYFFSAQFSDKNFVVFLSSRLPSFLSALSPLCCNSQFLMLLNFKHKHEMRRAESEKKALIQRKISYNRKPQGKNWNNATRRLSIFFILFSLLYMAIYIHMYIYWWLYKCK